uniref:Protein kinase domain-containing protein n=1 Tax=Sparus aurata TaxID=8175 RepID=A0A671Y001_SPAAU
MAMQARSYRAPEVMLGLPLSEAVDMWGVGCVAAFLYFGMKLFPGNCEYHWMKIMVQLLGQPEDHLLSTGIHSLQYFSTRSSTGYNADIGSEPATLGERDNFIKTQRDPSPARLWEEDAFTESFSGRNEAIERDAFIKTQRDPSPASLWEEAEITGPHNTNNSEEDIIEPSRTFQIQKNDVLVSNSTSYLVMDFIAEGCFGKVAKCLDLTTNKSVAVKIHTGNDEFVIQCEIEMLEAIRTLDPEKNNITRFLESFRFNNLSCLAFEMLDRSLFDLMIEGNMMPMRLNEIRPVIHQLLVAFDALKGINMVHTDLKPDNIMLVNQKDQPYRVKLIDFGLARPVRELVIGDIVQATGYRAPEVMLGLRLSEAIDMWGVGCVMAFLCFGRFLYLEQCEYEMMKFMVQVQGLPEDHMLRAGIYSLQYFSKVEGSSSPGWRLNSPEEYKEATGLQPQLSCNFFDILLKSCLHLDPSKRLTPKQALKHPFITMTHLVNDKDTNSYAHEAHQRLW